METMQRDTEIIIIDIRDSVEEFRCSRTPKDVRKLYSNFLLQTKQLTDIMRKEYHLLTGRKWEASKFTKWDAVSDFFYSLRNIHIHEAVARICVYVKSYHPLYVLGDPSIRLCIDSTVILNDQHLDKQPSPFILRYGDNLEFTIEPDEVIYSYQPDISNEKVKELASKLPTLDLHELVEKYFQIINDYYDYYISQLV